MCHKIVMLRINASFSEERFSRTLRVMDVRAENRGRPHQKGCITAAPEMGRDFLTPGHPGVRVRNVRGKSGPKKKSLCLSVVSFLILEKDINMMRYRGLTKGRFPKKKSRWFWRMFPGTKTGTRVRSDAAPERKPERGYVRQNHPKIRNRPFIWKKGKDPHPQDKIQHLDFTKAPRPIYYKTPPCVFYHKNVCSKAVFGP